MTRPSITPCLLYPDALAAIEFLCTAFGFTRHLIVPGVTPDQVAHAQLLLDGNMIMVSSAGPGPRERFGMVAPADTGGLVTSCLSVCVADPDAHHARAAAAGATVIAPPHDNPFGGRAYEVRDVGGNVWNFSSFDPYAAS